MTVAHILADLSSSDLVVDIKILDINIEPPVQSLRVKSILKKGYVLQVTESIGIDFRRYSYHLQKGGQEVGQCSPLEKHKNISISCT